MNDKELLALAAKAAGIVLEWGIIEGGKRLAPDNVCFHRNENGPRSIWNPLDDDENALRLAVQLAIRVVPYTNPEHGAAFTRAYSHGKDFDERHDASDMYAATRRAIVRAAADIGDKVCS